MLESYNKILLSAKENGYKSIVSVSLGTGVHGYKHIDIAKAVICRLNELVVEYDIDFILVLPSKENVEIYGK